MAPRQARLTPHGLRHSHKTWMVEDGIPEILSELRLGHEIPGMRGLYSHVSLTMRENLRAALQARWETSLKQRALIAPTSPVPVLDKLLAPIREQLATPNQSRPGRSRKNLASQIPPNSHLTAVEQVA